MSIHKAVLWGDIEVVKQHLAAGADVNAKDDLYYTPLHIAAQQGHKEIANLLIAKDADVNVTDKSGDTPLHEAASKGYKEVAELLVTNDADVNAKNDGESTPLHNAGRRGHKEIVELLIAGGADVNAKEDKFGITPLDSAIANDRTEIANLLRKHGGKTGAELSIHDAAANGNIVAVKQYLAAGIDVNAKNEDGETPLDRAFGVTVYLLRKHGGKTGEELKAKGK